jgi:hypothetical protein
MTVPVAKIQDRRGGNLANTDVVGKHTFTLFAIPVSDIRADSYLDESLYSLISDALAAAGYQTSKAKEGCGCEAPLKLVPELSKLNYWSYMWFWPLMFEGGGVDLRVRLVDADGNTLWRSSGDAGSFWLTPFGAWGFESALNGDLSKTAEELADEFRTPAFRQALEGSPAVPVQGTGH